MKISVVMTSYNYAQYLPDAIESVLNQTYEDWELVIVDDGSSDNSIEIINDYMKKDSRIKLFQHEGGVNKGLGQSVKLGVESATGDWVAFLESDDKFTPDSLEEKMLAISQNHDIELLFTGLEMFGEDNKIIAYNSYFSDINEMFVELDSSKYIDNFKKIIPKLNIIPTFSVVMLKKELIKNCSFIPICKASVDYYLWSQICNSKIYYLHKKLTYWRMHSESYINKDKNSWLERFVFLITIYYLSIRDKNPLIRTLLLVNYIRARLIYLKLDKISIKLNILNNKFIFEKFWS